MSILSIIPAAPAQKVENTSQAHFFYLHNSERPECRNHPAGGKVCRVCSGKESKNTRISPQLNLELTGASKQELMARLQTSLGDGIFPFLTVIEVCLFHFSPSLLLSRKGNNVKLFAVSKRGKNQLKKREDKNEFLHHWC